MTPERFARIKAVLARRQPDLTVLMENVHKPHNLSAILRSCDAVGVLEAHAVAETPEVAKHHQTAGGSSRWLRIRSHADIRSAVATLRNRGMQVLAAHFSPRAVDFREVDYTRPSAILLGAELTGVSADAARLADGHVLIPMLGHVASLNVSVAAAVILYEAQRQRAAAGLYERCRLATADYQQLLFEWCYPEVAALCRRQNRPYPGLDEQGYLLRE